LCLFPGIDQFHHTRLASEFPPAGSEVTQAAFELSGFAQLKMVVMTEDFMSEKVEQKGDHGAYGNYFRGNGTGQDHPQYKHEKVHKQFTSVTDRIDFPALKMRGPRAGTSARRPLRGKHVHFFTRLLTKRRRVTCAVSLQDILPAGWHVCIGVFCRRRRRTFFDSTKKHFV
jgi:hypothetical protein